MTSEEYVSTKTTRKILGVTTATLINWDKANKIRTALSPSGFRLYNKQDVFKIAYGDQFYEKMVEKERKKIIYCRVSSKHQKDDLQRQINCLQQHYPTYELVTDCGSGINWKRKGLQTILEQSMLGNVEEIVVAHKDRLCRFGFELIHFILDKNKTKLIVLNNNNDKSENEELAEDLLSIIHIFSCRQNGKRRYRKEQEN